MRLVEMDAQIGYRDRVLGDWRLTIDSGEVVVLRGPNGAGKSTMLATIAGLRKPLRGHVHVDGRRAASTRAKAAIGYVTDPPYLFEELTPGEHVDLVRAFWSARRHPAIDVSRGASFIEHVPERPASSLSLGQRKRISLALAVLHDPALLVLDEPFNGLDAAGSETLQQLLVRHCARGGSVICATHDTSAIDAVRPRVVDLRPRTGDSIVPVDRS